MHTALYVLWFLFPTVFFIMALWAKLEQMSGSVKKQDPGNFFRQGIFVLGCVFVSVLIDAYLLNYLVESFAPEFMPLGFFQVMLLPIVLVIGAKVIGPSHDILIGRKSPKRSGRKK